MLRRIGNRSYAPLNQVLQIAGGENVGFVDLSQAFLVHDLTPVIQSDRVESWLGYTTVVSGGSGNTVQSINPDVAGDWTTIYRNRNSDGAAIVRADEDFFVTLLGIDDTTGNLTTANFVLDAVVGGARVPVTYPLSRAAGGTILPAAGDLYYAVPMPFRFDFHFWDMNIFVTDAAANTTAVYVEGLVAPKGVVPKLLG